MNDAQAEQLLPLAPTDCSGNPCVCGKHGIAGVARSFLDYREGYRKGWRHATQGQRPDHRVGLNTYENGYCDGYKDARTSGVEASDGWSSDQPNTDGLWLWREGGKDHAVTLRLCSSGVEVDDAHAHEGESEDSYQAYWMRTPTDQKNMPGPWKRAHGVRVLDAADHAMLTAGAKSGDPGAMSLAAQLAGVPACEGCGYRKEFCRCATHGVDTSRADQQENTP